MLQIVNRQSLLMVHLYRYISLRGNISLASPACNVVNSSNCVDFRFPCYRHFLQHFLEKLITYSLLSDWSRPTTIMSRLLVLYKSKWEKCMIDHACISDYHEVNQKWEKVAPFQAVEKCPLDDACLKPDVANHDHNDCVGIQGTLEIRPSSSYTENRYGFRFILHFPEETLRVWRGSRVTLHLNPKPRIVTDDPNSRLLANSRLLEQHDCALPIFTLPVNAAFKGTWALSVTKKDGHRKADETRNLIGRIERMQFAHLADLTITCAVGKKSYSSTCHKVVLARQGYIHLPTT